MHYLLCLTSDEGYHPDRPADGYYLMGPFDTSAKAAMRRSSRLYANLPGLGPRVHVVHLPPGEAFRPPRLTRLDGAEARPVPGLYLASTGLLLGSLLFTGPLVTAEDLARAQTAARIGGIEPIDCLIRMDDALLHQPPVIVTPDGVVLEAA